MDDAEKKRLKRKSETEQGRAELVEELPPLLWGFFRQCGQEGFSISQAMTLTQGLLHGICVAPKGDAPGDEWKKGKH